MIKEFYTDKDLARRISYCSGADLDLLQGILNESHPKHSPKRYKDYESKEYMIHNFLKKHGEDRIDCDENSASGERMHLTYEEVVSHIYNVFGAKNKQSDLREMEKELAALFFKNASIAMSEENIPAAQKKYLKFKPDLLASMFCDEMRKQKNITGLLLLVIGVGGHALADKLQKFSFEEVTTLAFIVKLHFVMSRFSAA